MQIKEQSVHLQSVPWRCDPVGPLLLLLLLLLVCCCHCCCRRCCWCCYESVLLYQLEVPFSFDLISCSIYMHWTFTNHMCVAFLRKVSLLGIVYFCFILILFYFIFLGGWVVQHFNWTDIYIVYRYLILRSLHIKHCCISSYSKVLHYNAPCNLYVFLASYKCRARVPFYRNILSGVLSIPEGTVALSNSAWFMVMILFFNFNHEIVFLLFKMLHYIMLWE